MSSHDSFNSSNSGAGTPEVLDIAKVNQDKQRELDFFYEKLAEQRRKSMATSEKRLSGSKKIARFSQTISKI